MRFILVLALLSTLGVYYAKAENIETNLERPPLAQDDKEDAVEQENEVEQENATESALAAPCEYKPCKRIYSPVCGLIDGFRITAPSRCEFNNKARCSKAVLNPDQDLPATFFMYRGPCRRINSRG